MQRVFIGRILAAFAATFLTIALSGCGGNNTADTTVVSIVLSPTTVSLNEGGVVTLSAVSENSSGSTVAADLTFTSSNNAIATVSTGSGLVCAGTWDANFINCTPNSGQAGVGQVMITATSVNNVTASIPVYVHQQVDRVEALLGGSGCTSMGQPINITGKAYNTTAPGCSLSAPCDITSTVGPFTFGGNDPFVAATSSGIQATYSSIDNTPTYFSGGTISGSRGQTCNLSDFNTVLNATATVTLTGANTIDSGTQLTITNPGYGATGAASAATLSNGTATCSGRAIVATDITTGILTAQTPGTTSVFASVSGVNGVGVPFTTCTVSSIMVHDASSSNTTFTISPMATQGLAADVIDTKGTSIMPTLTWGSSAGAAATVVATTGGNNLATVTAVKGGTTFITAACSYPDCNRNVAAQYSQNVVTLNVTQPAASMAYATNVASKTLVPINTSTNAVGTAITLPYYPNSIFTDPRGTNVYLGSGSGLMVVSVSTGTVTPYAAPGTIVAVSPDGNALLLSDSTGNMITYFDAGTGTVSSMTPGTTGSSAYTPDSKFNEWISGTELVWGTQNSKGGTVTLPTAGNAVGISGQGSLTYVTSAAGSQVYLFSTCDASMEQMLPATNPTLIKGLPSGVGAVAADSPDIGVITTPLPLNTGCPATVMSALNTYDLGAGGYTAKQMLVSYDATHAYVISNLPQILSFNLTSLAPGSAALAGGATAYSGGITLDGSKLFVGATDGKVHVINTATMTDTAQIAVSLTDNNGNPAVPNLVAVAP